MKYVPQSVFESEATSLVMDFHCRDGRVHGFPCGHLLHFLHETNSEDLPNAPAERFLLSFSTRDVILFGWRLKRLVPLLCAGRLASVHAIEARYYGLTRETPFVCDIRVEVPPRE